MRLRWLLRQEGRQEIDWTTKYIVFSKFERPAKVGSHNAIASIFTNYRTFLEPLFTGTHLTRNLVNYYWQFPLSLGKDVGFSRDLTRLIRTTVFRIMNTCFYILICICICICICIRNWNQWNKEINEHKWNSKNYLERDLIHEPASSTFWCRCVNHYTTKATTLTRSRIEGFMVHGTPQTIF